MTLLRTRGLCAFYGDFQALFDIDLNVDEGETVAIIGANGAGKTTFLRAVIGQLRSEPAMVEFDGRAIGAHGAHEILRFGIAMVPEGRKLFPSLTVEENLAIGTYRGRRGRWDVASVMELFPLLGLLRVRSAAVLSGGEQQALAIGRALMANPRLLLLDEVSLGLAPVVVGQVYKALPEISRDGTTILLVEQNIEQALGVAERVYCLLEGRVVLQGRPAELERGAITSAYFGI